MKLKHYIFVLIGLCFSSITQAQTLVASELPAGVERVEIGSFKSRGYWIKSATPGQPVVVLIPGSGPNGPEEVAPPAQTADGQFHSVFGPIAKAFVKAGYNVLLLGKPGVEFFTDGDMKKWLYDQNLYAGLKWEDLITNLKNGVDFVLSQKDIDANRLFLLGHSEATHVVVDYATRNPNQVAGLFLLGYLGVDMATIVDWQLYKQEIEFLWARDVDKNHDSIVNLEEASFWPELGWLSESGLTEISFSDYESALREQPSYQQIYTYYKTGPLYADVFSRGPIYEQTAKLKQPIYVFNGELDVATPVSQVKPLEDAVKAVGKTNIRIEIVPGLTHGFSLLKEPRKQVLLDNTMGPVDPSFLVLLESVAKSAVAQP